MGVRIIAVLLFVAFASTSYSYSQPPLPKFFKKADRFFKKYIVEGKVDYLTIRENPAQLNDLIKFISEATIQGKSPSFKEAFYINAYHLLLIKNVIDNFPVLFPLERIGFFSKATHPIAGDTLTLNEIESLFIREYKDVRILFALSSASIGSVPIAEFAYKPRKLNKQLKRRVREIVNDFAFIRVMNRSSKILMAEDFKRSQLDFDKKDIVELINEYREKPLPVGFAIEFYPVNRKLNSKN